MLNLSKRNRIVAALACLMILCAFTHTIYADEIDTKYFAHLIFDAKERADFLPDIHRINPNVSEQILYEIQKHYVAARLDAGEVIGGFKGGFVPKASVGGVLFGGDKILGGKPQLQLADFGLLIIEAEIGFRFCETITEPVPSLEKLKTYVCAIMPVVEVADGALADFGSIKKNFTHLRNSLIAINVASSHTFVGQSASPSSPLANLPIVVTHDGEKIGERDLAQSFDFWNNLLWIVNDYVLKQGYSIAEGHFIIAGNLTGIHVAERGEFEADFGALGKLQLSVE
ncbi:MAG: hypothetical protein AAF387_05300 [Pseudomonadota bacterium]